MPKERDCHHFGIISAQLAELFSMGKEFKILTQTEEAQKRQQAKFLPPHSRILQPYRFRDNIVGVLRGKVGLARVQRWFEHVYQLNLEQEGEGVVLPSLEATISLHLWLCFADALCFDYY